MIMRMPKVVSLLCKVNLFKTLYFNLKYFPLKQALHLPVLIYRCTELLKMKGRVVINAPVRMGLVKMGVHEPGVRYADSSKTIWEVSGVVIINGKVSLGRGSKICVAGVLTMGDGFYCTGNSSIVCQKEITFGNDCFLSYEVCVMDTDFRHLLTERGEVPNGAEPIIIGNAVWIDCRNAILKGVTIADFTTIAPDSTVTQSLGQS